MAKVIVFNGPPGCVDAETEFLTKSGWVPISEYKEGMEVYTYHEDGTAFFEEPNSFVESDESVRFLSMKGLYCDMALTENHRILCKTGKTGRNRVITAVDLAEKLTSNKYGFDGKVPTTFLNVQTGFATALTNEMLKFIVMYSAESTVKNARTGYSCISLKHDYKKKTCRDILIGAGIDYKEAVYDSMPEYTRFYFHSPVEKGLPKYFYELSMDQCIVVKDELFHWDGDSETCSYRTTIKDEADIAQFVISATGALSTIYEDDRRGETYGEHGQYTRKSVCYRVACLDRREGFGLESVKASEGPLGKCYCFTTSTGFWVARRNGKIFVTGNSGKDTAATSCLFAVGSFSSGSCEIRPFKEKLFRLTCEMYSIPYDTFTGEMYTRENKEKPYQSLGWLSPREALIKVSEEIMKPAFGEDYFGKALAADISEYVTLVPDSGFMDELVPVVESVGPKNVLVVKIHKNGCNFNNDSRSYLDEEKLKEMGVFVEWLENKEGSQLEFEEEVSCLAVEWIDGYL